MPETFVHFEISAEDPEKLQKIYGVALGWTFNSVLMPGGGGEYTIVMTADVGKPGTNGGLYKKMGKDDKPRHYMGVADMDDPPKGTGRRRQGRPSRDAYPRYRLLSLHRRP